LAAWEIPQRRCVLSLYTAHDLSHASLERGKYYRYYPARFFWGTQAVYYPADVRLEIAQYIEENRERRPGDLLLGEWCRARDCLFNTDGSLVQHVGMSSTGLGRYHRAWNYSP